MSADKPPERIWANNPIEITEHEQRWWYENAMAFPTVEYIRADLMAAVTQERDQVQARLETEFDESYSARLRVTELEHEIQVATERSTTLAQERDELRDNMNRLSRTVPKRLEQL